MGVRFNLNLCVPQAAREPLELAVLLLALEANVAVQARSRLWGVERSGLWRAQLKEGAPTVRYIYITRQYI